MSRFVADLRDAVGQESVSQRATDLARMAHDASHYLLEPTALLVANDADAVSRAVAVAARHGVAVTFRSGGTSLSGQGVTRGLLIDTRRGFRDVEVLDDGARVRCQPGATVRAVNAALAPYRAMLGPDPASETACTIGGVVANNSSGMACGTERNTYRTLDAIQVILPSGTLVDTSLPDADERLRAAEPAIYEGLARLRDRVRGNADSVRRIAHQYSMKNTMGYSVNAFVDHDSPVQILAHLIVGSEGTLGFIMSATFRTVPVRAHTGTALLVFDRIDAATGALPALVAAGAVTAELMDAASLRVAQAMPTVVPALRRLQVIEHTALLVEAQDDLPEGLVDQTARLDAIVADLDGLTPSMPASFDTDPVFRGQAWQVRKGLLTAVAGARPPGSTALLEDVVVPMPALTGTVLELQQLCVRHGHDDAVIFGHAKDANLHFLINPDLGDPAQVEAFARFSDELVDLILGADGSLKAEHGTGRVMAPFVERQFGSELYAVMREVKALVDPGGTLNPGVVISGDPRAHLADLKVSALVDPAVDRCMECGFCEPVCPSRDLTTTPRQRIVLMREIAVASGERREELERDFAYAAVSTCAVDSLCLLNCPVAIDTGSVMKRHRAQAAPAPAQRAGEAAAGRWGSTLATLRAGVAATDRIPGALLTAASTTARKVLPHDLVPLVGDDLPGPGTARRPGGRHRGRADVVLLPSCLGEIFAPPDNGLPRRPAGRPGSAFSLLRVCDRAGVRVRIPETVADLCCGTVWRSKGLLDGRTRMAATTVAALWEASEHGRLPVMTDASSCSHGLHELAHDLRDAGESELAATAEQITVVDSTRFVAERVLPRLAPRMLGSVVVHPTCSDRHAADLAHIVAIAQACAAHVEVPVEAGCCGFAGDRGLLHPELTASATSREAREVGRARYDAYVSTNRTCEWGLTRATGRTYRHVVELLDALTTD